MARRGPQTQRTCLGGRDYYREGAEVSRVLRARQSGGRSSMPKQYGARHEPGVEKCGETGELGAAYR
jgi:hypothetical protein